MKKILKSLCSLLILSSLVGCDSGGNTPDPEPTIEDRYDYGWNESYLMKDTMLETPVYVYKSQTAGPRVAIVGGIHGDEVAGWKCAEGLLNRIDYVGTVMIIPYANILADAASQRYVGIGNSGKVTSTYLNKIRNSSLMRGKTIDESFITTTKFTDLNRVMPGDKDGDPTDKLAYELYNTIIDFLPNYCVDLHESRHDHTLTKKNDNTYLGSSLIYGNAIGSIACTAIVEEYNKLYPDNNNYKEFSVICGTSAAPATDPTYDYRFVKQVGIALNRKKSRVLTIETNRECTSTSYNPTDGRDLSYRLQEQNWLVDMILNRAVSEYNDGTFK